MVDGGVRQINCNKVALLLINQKQTTYSVNVQCSMLGLCFESEPNRFGKRVLVLDTLTPSTTSLY
jgi:hypothetical protein